MSVGRHLTGSKADAEDVVSEAFARVLSALQRGAGPEMAFRPYLLTSVRNAFYDRTRKDKRLDVTDDVPEDLGRVLAAAAASDDDVERQMAATAFASLPERWQLVLWHTEVEGRSPAEVGPLLGLAPNAVAALAYRAREGLRQAYLNAHIQARPPAGCEDIVPKLGAYVRHDLSNRDRQKVEAHLEGCERCRAIVAELEEAGSRLKILLIPLIAGIPAAAYLGGLAPSGAGAVLVLTRATQRVKDMGPAGQVAVALGSVAAAGLLVVGAVAAARSLTGSSQQQTVSEAGDRIVGRLGRRRLRRRRRWGGLGLGWRERGHGAECRHPGLGRRDPIADGHRRPHRLADVAGRGGAPAARRGSRRSSSRPRLVPHPRPRAPRRPARPRRRRCRRRRPRRRPASASRSRARARPTPASAPRSRSPSATARPRPPRRARSRTLRARAVGGEPPGRGGAGAGRSRRPAHHHHPARARRHLRRRRQPDVGLLGRGRDAVVRAAGPRSERQHQRPDPARVGGQRHGDDHARADDRGRNRPAGRRPAARPHGAPGTRRRHRARRRPCRPGPDGQRHRDLRSGDREVLRHGAATTRPRRRRARSTSRTSRSSGSTSTPIRRRSTRHRPT